MQIAKTNFEDETTKIRLLKGFIYANEARNLEMHLEPQKFLICRRFWLDEPAATRADESNKFNYQEVWSKFEEMFRKPYIN